MVIWASAVFAAVVSVRKLTTHGTTSHLGVGIAAALAGIVGNQLVARYKLQVGRRIQSATLVADAQHSWLDAISSAGAMVGLIGVAFGLRWADAAAGLLITGFIIHVGYEVTSDLVGHLMDGVDPGSSAPPNKPLERWPVSSTPTSVPAGWDGRCWWRSRASWPPERRSKTAKRLAGPWKPQSRVPCPKPERFDATLNTSGVADGAGTAVLASELPAVTRPIDPRQEVSTWERAASLAWGRRSLLPPTAPTDYKFSGLPDKLPAGVVQLKLTNSGKEDHEMLVLRRKPGVTESFDQILALPREQGMQKTEAVTEVSASPGKTDATVGRLTPGQYVIVCTVSKGTMGDTHGDGPPHFMLGMKKEVTVS